jgi:hypothetical protein
VNKGSAGWQSDTLQAVAAGLPLLLLSAAGDALRQNYSVMLMLCCCCCCRVLTGKQAILHALERKHSTYEHTVLHWV